MKTLVFVGPTLRDIELANADIRPPVAVGDILRALRDRRVRRIAIIDGYFERMAAVWHKEILVALARGVEVWGAASMGALRAAELAPYGMRGIGKIYEAYRRGELVADDEVAVAHLPAEYGYRATSVALVDIRFALAAALRARRISKRDHDRHLAAARARFYRERTWDLPFPLRSQKTADARALVAALARARPTRPPRIAVPRTWALRQLERML